MGLKPNRLKKGDTVALVTLSAGSLYEADNVVELGRKRLANFGLKLKVMPHAQEHHQFIFDHPEIRAADLKAAFLDNEVQAILCTIGGSDTYRLAPFLLDDPEFVTAVQQHPKVFMGFSDTTLNHLVFHKLGLNTFYGPSFLNDFADIGTEMLPFSIENFEHFFKAEPYELKSSPIWYDERQDFSESSWDVSRMPHREKKGYESLYGQGFYTGQLLGGCIESLFDLLTGNSYADEPAINEQYQLWPNDWVDKVIFLEPSQENPTPHTLSIYLHRLAQTGMFDQATALIIGKTQNNAYYNEYKKIYKQLAKRHNLPVLYNINFGHGFPRLSIPYGINVKVDMGQAKIWLQESPWQ